jgi:GT2 family glycosyltransferase
MDDDVCPTGNVMKLVKHDFDVIGLSCPFYDESKRRFALAVGGQEDVNNADAMHCEWVGTACVMIARRVLEHRAMAAPFQFRFDGDGIRTTSEDVSFCLRAREAGFTVWASKRYSCEHYKTMPLTHCWQDQQDAAMYRQFVKRHDLY